MNVQDLLEQLDGAGLVITDWSAIEEELDNQGVSLTDEIEE